MKIRRLSILSFILVLFELNIATLAQIEEWMVRDTSNSILPSNYVTSIVEDLNGDIWIGTYGGLVSITENGWCLFNKNNSNYPSNLINTLSVDSNNVLWIGFEDAGVIKYKNGILEHYTAQNSYLPSNWVHQIVVDRINRKWIATELGRGMGGVLVVDDTTLVSYTIENSELPSGTVKSINVDDSLNAWIGMEYMLVDPGPIYGGLAKFDGTTWITYNYDTPGFSQGWTFNCIEVENDTIWVGTDRGLSKFDGNVWSTFLEENSGLPNNYVNALFAEPNGTKWLGVGRATHERKGALVKYSNESFTKFDTTNSPILPGYVASIFVDSQQNKWIAIHPYWDQSTTTSYGGGLAIYNENGVVVNVDEKYEEAISKEFILSNNYPNPFNPTTIINYSIPESGFTILKVFNILGSEVATLVYENKLAGKYKVKFDASNLSSGVYIYTLSQNNKKVSKKMLLLK